MPFILGFVLALIAFVVYAFIKGFKSAPSSQPTPGTRTHCSVCGAASVKVDGQYCSDECAAKLAKSMDDWHDRFDDMYK